jgi:ABC-type multidrug transport system fused ATPase/permease subunit
VLDRVDLRLDPGRRIAIVGPSGSGKTTIAEVLVRFRDLDAGRATLDGQDIGLYAQDEVRRRVRLCEQAAHLFTGSIRDNVLIGRPGASDADVRAALDTVGLRDWIEDLPHGIDTPVGEAGAEVSGGQRSRIALARVVISEAAVMILDEPAAHLDPSSARELIERILATSPGRSVLLITHSPIGLESFDEVRSEEASASGDKDAHTRRLQAP